MNAGPSAANPLRTLVIKSCQWLGLAWAAYTGSWAIMISVRSFGNCIFPGITFPEGLVVACAPIRRRAGALNAGIHVRAVIVADIQKIVTAFNRAGRGLQPDVVGSAIPANRQEFNVFIHRQFPAFFERSIHGFHPGNRRRYIFKSIVNIRECSRPYTDKSWSRPRKHPVATATTSGFSAANKNLPEDRAGRAARAQPVTTRQLIRFS